MLEKTDAANRVKRLSTAPVKTIEEAKDMVARFGVAVKETPIQNRAELLGRIMPERTNNDNNSPKGGLQKGTINWFKKWHTDAGMANAEAVDLWEKFVADTNPDMGGTPARAIDSRCLVV